ncbi:MAG: hypothetical protein VKJ06_09335 [Vampirovibrionales bacterium]|nr:hypothetical protein [Vampirovibrionales bacterium]
MTITLLTAVNAVLVRTGQETVASLEGLESPAKQCVQAINDTLADMSLRLRLFRQAQSATISVAQGATEVSLPVPSDRLTPGSLWIEGALNPLGLASVASFNGLLPAAGMPTRALLQGQTLKLHPTADKAYTLRLSYAPSPVPLSLASDVLPIPDDWAPVLYKGAQALLEQFLGEASSGTQLGLYLEGINQLRALAAGLQGPKRMRGGG